MAEYIEKQAAKEKLCGMCRWEGTSNCDECEHPIDDIPPADVRSVRRGQWKPFDLTYGRSIYSCTSCEEATYVPTEMGKPTYRYCPNCGADMRGEEHDND